MLLQKVFLLSLVLVYVTSDDATEHHVTIREVSQTSNEASPNHLHVHFTLNGKDVNLRLKRNAKIDVNAPITFEDGSNPGHMATRQAVDLYQDVKNFATISARSALKSGAYKRELHGSFEHGTDHFTLEPVKIAGKANHDHVIRKRAIQPIKRNGDSYPTKTVVDDEEKKPNMTVDDRRKRSISVTDYHVQIKMVIDYTVWQLFMENGKNDETTAMNNIRYHFSHLMNGMDLVFSGIEAGLHGFTISLWLSGFHIAKTASSSIWANGAIMSTGWTPEKTVVVSKTVLANLVRWSHEGGRTWNNPDHYMLFTRYDLAGKVVGIAASSGICSGAGVSANEYMDFHGWQVQAHELAHNLGSPHDGSDECPSAQGNVMMPDVPRMDSEQSVRNAYQFSFCTIQYMKFTIQGRRDGFPRLCLTDNPCGQTSTVLQKLPGEKYDVDEQCRVRQDDQNTKACNADQAGVCLNLRCSLSNENCERYYILSPGAADGSSCGGGKVCMQSKCVTKTAGSSSSKNCVARSLDTSVPNGCTDKSWYRRRFIDGTSYSCNELAVAFPKFCYTDHDAARFCCASCRGAGIKYPNSFKSCTDFTSGKFYLNTGNGRLLNDCAGYAASGICQGILHLCCASCLSAP